MRSVERSGLPGRAQVEYHDVVPGLEKQITKMLSHETKAAGNGDPLTARGGRVQGRS